MRGGSSACGSGRGKKGRAGGLEASRLGGRTHSVAVAVAEQFPEGAPIVRGGLAHTCSSSTPLNKDGWSWAQLLIPGGAAALTPATAAFPGSRSQGLGDIAGAPGALRPAPADYIYRHADRRYTFFFGAASVTMTYVV